MSDTQLDHIKYMGLTRRRQGARENPPPEPSRTAFLSPMLEYSAALEEGLLSPNRQPALPPLHWPPRYTHARTHAHTHTY